MPLNKTGKKVMDSMKDTYCEKDANEPCKKAKEVFYATNNKRKNKGEESWEVQTESLRDFINSIKREDNKVFIENVIMKGFNACFEEVNTVGQDETPDSEKTAETIEKTEEKVEDLTELQSGQEQVEDKVEEIQTKAEQEEAERNA